MNQNLKARLSRLRAAGKVSPGRETSSAPGSEIPQSCGVPQSAAELLSIRPGWENSGYKTLTRTVSRDLPLPLPGFFPRALPILVPDIFRLGTIPALDDLLFFDLETTGLSGGAGTIAFLAAFGRFVLPSRSGAEQRGARLIITQYLLLDYPGENDFVERAVEEFSPRGKGATPLVVSFNGKSFDSQILRNRCLMNGIAPPEYHHADLLHPARRLWKRILPDCKQATIETSLLDLDRSGDISGALAPEIWFSFLKSGDTRDLLSICDHNARDVAGLAVLFLALAGIAAEPSKRGNSFRVDKETLALFWRRALKQNPSFFGESERETGKFLLENAAENGCPFAALVLAKEAEWRAKDFNLALRYTRLALAAHGIPESLRESLEGRKARLERKSLAARKASRRGD